MSAPDYSNATPEEKIKLMNNATPGVNYKAIDVRGQNPATNVELSGTGNQNPSTAPESYRNFGGTRTGIFENETTHARLSPSEIQRINDERFSRAGAMTDEQRRRELGAIEDFRRRGLGRADAMSADELRLASQGMAESRAGLGSSIGNQEAFANALAGMAVGQGGPSAAEALMRRNASRGLQSAMALARSGGGNAGLALRQAQNIGAQTQQQAINDAAILRAQEQQAMSGLAAQALQGVSGARANMAGLDVDSAKADLGARLSQRQDVERMRAAAESAGLVGMLDAYQRQRQANMAALQGSTDAFLRERGIDAGLNVAQQQQAGQIGGAAATALGALLASSIGAAAASDERLKKGVRGADEDVEKFMDALSAKSYEYKNKAFGEGRRLGIMAQDMEKSPMGDGVVVETPAGKMIDTKRALSAVLASVANLNERIKKVEG